MCDLFRSKFRRLHEISLRNFNKDKFKPIFKKFRQNFNFIKGDWRWRIARRRISWWRGRNWNGTLAGDSMSRKTIKLFFLVLEPYLREEGGGYISADFECFSRVSKFSLADFTAILLVQYKVNFEIREIHSKSAKM